MEANRLAYNGSPEQKARDKCIQAMTLHYAIQFIRINKYGE